MKEDQVLTLAAKGSFHGRPIQGKIEETHISWVILTRKHAFKIKKPLKLSFLDFSTLRLRKKNCERELRLNSRFTDIYLSVLPVRCLDDRWFIGGNRGRVADYAVHMKRMALSKRMDNLLLQRKVRIEAINSLAAVIASFHGKAITIFTPFNLTQAGNTFNDIKDIRNVAIQAGFQFPQVIDKSVKWSDSLLRMHAKRIQQRIDRGFRRDVHGDLHSGNIFLYRKPVLFDCIEFNDQYRQIDVLYEIAFLCMDLEAFDKAQLAKSLLSSYVRRFPCLESKEDESIFLYYKCLRANVRAKVHALAVTQADNETEKLHHLRAMTKYLQLMRTYMEA